MKNFQTKVNDHGGPDSGVSKLDGAKAENSLRDENKNAVSRSGQTLTTGFSDDTNTLQLGRALFINGIAAQSFQDSGTANEYVATPVTGASGLVFPDSYTQLNGAIVTFEAGNTNTDASTLNIGQTTDTGTLLGTKAIVDATGNALTGGEITAGDNLLLQYDPAVGAGSWRLKGKLLTEGGASGPAGGDLEGTYPNPVIGDDKVTYSKMQETASASRLIGRGSASAGNPQEITPGTGLTMSGTTLNSTASGTAGGDLIGSYPNPTIANNAVTYAKIQDVTNGSRLIGRGAGAGGDPQEITLGTGLSMTGTVLNSSGGSLDDLPIGEVRMPFFAQYVNYFSGSGLWLNLIAGTTYDKSAIPLYSDWFTAWGIVGDSFTIESFDEHFVRISSSRAVGNLQSALIGGHRHRTPIQVGTGGSFGTTSYARGSAGYTAANLTDDGGSNGTGGADTDNRPQNIAAKVYVKYQ